MSKKTLILTAQEIADDVQQSLGEEVTNEYRLLIETRIINLLTEQNAQAYDGIKRILAHNFTQERDKNRISDAEKNKELLNHLGSALTIIETTVKENLTRLLIKGEDIFSIVPKRDQEKIEQELDGAEDEHLV